MASMPPSLTVNIDRTSLVSIREALVTALDALDRAGSELNEVYWRLARALGLVEDGDSLYNADPEAILVQVEEELFRIKEFAKGGVLKRGVEMFVPSDVEDEYARVAELNVVT